MHDNGAFRACFIFNLHTRVSFVFTQHTINRYLHNEHAVIIKPLAKITRNPSYILGRPASCSWWRIPIHSGPLSGNNCPTLWLLPLSPLSHPSAHITLFAMTTSTITVFFVWDSYKGEWWVTEEIISDITRGMLDCITKLNDRWWYRWKCWVMLHKGIKVDVTIDNYRWYYSTRYVKSYHWRE